MMDDKRKHLLRNLPKMDDVIALLEGKDIYHRVSRDIAVEACREVVRQMRDQILSAQDKQLDGIAPDAADAAARAEQAIQNLYHYKLRRVINATGVILHTNLGRAPLCHEALERITEVAQGYCNLEYNLARGERGLRYDAVTQLLCALSGAEDALIVNNNAAAVLLVLNSLSENKESIVSRGELIEIGGEFRIPDVMTKSSAILREVGTTNRTRLSDYEKAIGPQTGLILKVHTSNYRIIGFTEEADLMALVALGKKAGIPVYNDLGSGCLINLEDYGLRHEPTVREVLASGVDVVTFSGDKLLGGPQAGIIVGKTAVLSRIKKNPLNRALRIDKFTLAALEATLMQYLSPEGPGRMRSVRALIEPQSDVKKRAQKLLSKLRRASLPNLTFALRETQAAAGGGSLPGEDIPSWALAVRHAILTSARMEAKLRLAELPVLVRTDEEEILLDLRTLAETEFDLLVKALQIVAAD